MQLSNGYRERPRKRTWKVEHNSNLLREKEERAQLSVNGENNGTVCLHDLRDNLSVTRTNMCPSKMCSSKVPTTTSWSNGLCNRPAASIKTMWIQHGSLVKLENSDDNSEPDRNSTEWHLLGEYAVVALENDLPVSKEQIVAKRLNSKNKSIPVGCIENTENKKKNFSRRNVEKSLYLLIMMMDGLTTFQEYQIQNRSMKRLEYELSLTYPPAVSQY